MLNSNPYKAKFNQHIMKILAVSGVFVLIVGVVMLKDDSKENESKKARELKAKIEATKLVNEDDMVKSVWMNDVSEDVALVNQSSNDMQNENKELKEKIANIETMLREQKIEKRSEKEEDTKKQDTIFGKFPMPFTKNENGKMVMPVDKDIPVERKIEPIVTKLSDSLNLQEYKKEVKSDEGKQNEDVEEEKEYIPTGSISKVRLLNGFDAPTMAAAKTNPLPILMKITDMSILPNKYKYDLRECFVVGEGYGDLASERVYIRTNNISCISKSGKQVDMPFKAMASGEDGKVGLRGRVVSKQGAALARTIIAGFVGSVGSAFGGQGQSIADSSSALTGGVVSGASTNLDTKATLESGIYKGFGNAANKLSDFYLKLADQTAPVIEIDSNRHIELITTARTELKFEKLTTKKGKNEK